MALTLDPALLTAQNSKVHHPIVKLTSHSPVASIPFDGNHISAGTAETESQITMLSSGRLVFTYLVNSVPYMSYSDLNRTVWSHGHPITYDTNYYVTSISNCEMPDGNVAIVYALAAKSGTYQALVSHVYTPTAVNTGIQNTNFWNTGAGEWDYGITLAYDGSVFRYVFATYSGSYHCFRTGTSPDLVTWSNHTILTVPNLPSNYTVSNPSLVFPADGQAPIMAFDYIELYDGTGLPLKNIYTVQTLDNFVTLENAVKRTERDRTGDIALQPYITQSATDQLLISWVDETPTLFMSLTQTDGLSSEAAGAYYGWQWVTGIFLDPVSRIFYVQGYGSYALSARGPMNAINLDSWEPDDYWDTSTLPAIADGGGGKMFGNKNSGVYNGLLAWMQNTNDVIVLNPQANTLKHWYFANTSYRNVNWRMRDHWIIWHDFGMGGTAIGADGWLYMYFTIGYTHNQRKLIGRIHVEDPGPTYEMQELYFASSNNIYQIKMFDTEGTLIYIMANGITLMVWDGDRMVVQTSFWFSDAQYNCPNAFPNSVHLEGGDVFISFDGQDGIWKLNIEQRYATRIQTSWTISCRMMEYAPEIRALMLSGNSGLHVFYLDELRWETYNTSTVQGIVPYSGLYFTNVLYDPVQDGFVLGNAAGNGYGHAGVSFIPRNGKINQIVYTELDYTTQWDMGTPSKLVNDYSSSEPSIAFVPGSTEFYALWTDKDIGNGDNTLAWDKNESEANITGYIVDDTEVNWKRNILGDACTLDFTLAPGQLFDPWNLSSMIAKYVKKGRELRLFAGERIGGVDYLVAQGSYYVHSSKRSYKRGDASVTRVSAEDRLEQIKAVEVAATEYLPNWTGANGFKEYAVAHGAVDDLTEIDSVPFIGDKSMFIQFIDADLYDILYTIAWRFGCMIRYDMNGKLDCRVVPGSGVNHTYSDSTAMLEFTPNDDYSDYTNNVIVNGVDDDLVEVIHKEEMVAQLSGSVGWWGEPETYTIYYSEDHEKVVENVRLEVISSATSIAMQLAGGVSEDIIYEDPLGKYCKVKVDAPNLIPALIVAAVGYLYTSNTIGDAVAALGGGTTIPVGRRFEGIFLFAALNILGSVATFQYEIWGQPIGHVERSIQNFDLSASDPEHIAYMGKIFTKELDGWQCVSTSECLSIALRELEIVKMQRKRVEFKKIAHLQDEEGDIISIKHPEGGQALLVNIVELTRTFKKSLSGYFKDSIQGWIQ